MKKYFFIALIALFSANLHAGDVPSLPTAGAHAFSVGPMGNDLTMAFDNPKYEGSFNGHGTTWGFTFGAGVIVACSISQSNLDRIASYPDGVDVEYEMLVFPAYAKINIGGRMSNTPRAPYMFSCDAYQTGSPGASFSGQGRLKITKK